MKKAVLTTIQVLVTVGILLWVFHDPTQREQMWYALKRSNPGWLMAGIGCYGLVELLAAFRWFLLLRVHGVRISPLRVGALFMLGIFFNMFMPGGTGGDVLKVYFLFKEIPAHKEKGLLAVLMDRVIGLLALILVSSAIIGFQYNWLKTSPASLHWTWVLLAILVSSLGSIVFSFIISGFGLAHRLPPRLPMRDKLIDVSKAYNAYAREWPASLFALFLSFGVHMSGFFLYVCAARALNLNLTTGAVLTVMPIIITIASLPISVGGAGVREAMFVAMLGPLCHLAQADAKILSITGWGLTAVWGLVGGAIYLLYRPSQHAKLREVEREVHEVEHEIAETD